MILKCVFVLIAGPVVVMAVLVTVVILSLLAAASTDPGIIPRAAPDTPMEENLIYETVIDGMK